MRVFDVGKPGVRGVLEERGKMVSLRRQARSPEKIGRQVVSQGVIGMYNRVPECSSRPVSGCPWVASFAWWIDNDLRARRA